MGAHCKPVGRAGRSQSRFRAGTAAQNPKKYPVNVVHRGRRTHTYTHGPCDPDQLKWKSLNKGGNVKMRKHGVTNMLRFNVKREVKDRKLLEVCKVPRVNWQEVRMEYPIHQDLKTAALLPPIIKRDGGQAGDGRRLPRGKTRPGV